SQGLACAPSKRYGVPTPTHRKTKTGSRRSLPPRWETGNRKRIWSAPPEEGAQSLEKGGLLRGLLGRGGGLRVVEGGLHKDLLAVQPGLAVLGLLPEVGAAGLEEGGLGIVPQLGVQDGLELAL